MIVYFLSDLFCDKRFAGAQNLSQLKGRSYKHGDTIIVVDNMLLFASHHFECGDDVGGYKALISTVIHELIHELAEWYPREYIGLIYDSPVCYLVDRVFEALE